MGTPAGRDSWITEALRMGRDLGIEAIKVEVLARRMGVTKGSFYWHFSDRAALLDALLETWEREGTLDLIALVGRASPDPTASDPATRLRHLTRIAFGADARLERSLRAWALHDERAAVVLRRVDRRRVRYIGELMREHGVAPATCKARARLFYAAYVGEQYLAVQRSARRRVASALDVLETLLGSGRA